MQIVGVPSGYVGRGVTAVGCKNSVGEALRAHSSCWLRSPPQKGPAPVAWYTSEAGCRWLGVFRSMKQAIPGNMVTGAIVEGVSCLLR